MFVRQEHQSCNKWDHKKKKNNNNKFVGGLRVTLLIALAFLPQNFGDGGFLQMVLL